MDEVFSGRSLARILLKKLRRRMHGTHPELIAMNGDFAVLDRIDLYGGGLEFGQKIPRLLLEIGRTRCRRVFEFCAGPGYIGYTLLALGFCESLALADVNPAAVDVARRTAEINDVTDRVPVYLSDAINDIPASERWDLVVSNPPHFLTGEGAHRLRLVDDNWQIHRSFYRRIGEFMTPGGRVVMQEASDGSSADEFIPMIERAGGTVSQVIAGTSLNGIQDGYYYIVSTW